MSATNRGTKRREGDFYPTPGYVVDELLAELNLFRLAQSAFLEPCRGDGSLYDRINARYKLHAELSEGIDYLDTQFTGIDVIITNPPFSLAEEFLEKSLSEAPFVAYLMRLNFLGSQDRVEFWNRMPVLTHLFTMGKRPAFVSVCKGSKPKNIKSCGATYPVEYTGPCSCGGRASPGTDSTEYAWYVWDFDNICNRRPGVYSIWNTKELK